jgi:hypothetical protein
MLDKKVFKSGYSVSKDSKVAKGEHNDCVVRAIANSFNLEYDEAHEFTAEKFGRKNRKSTKECFSKMKTLSKDVVEFPKKGQLDLFNGSNSDTFRIKYVGSEPKKGGKLINRDYTHKKVAYTVKAFMNKYKVGTYFILVNKHALVIKDGQIIDNPDMRFTGYRRVVEHAFKIKKVEPKTTTISMGAFISEYKTKK